MYLSRIHVENFRNLIDVSVDLKPGLNVIVGENNVGKTNLLDAVRIAFGAAATGSEWVSPTKEDRHRSADGVYSDQPIHITLMFQDLSHDQQADFLDALNYDAESPELSTATIQYTWAYSPLRDRWSVKRWGSDRTDAEGQLGEDVLQALPLTYLAALRDAERALVPGRNSRLARLLAATANQSDRDQIREIGSAANRSLQQTELVRSAEERIAGVLDTASRTDLMRPTAIRPAPADFERMIRALRILLRPSSGNATDETLLDELSSNGLGYNNLIYMAVVLAELGAQREAALPLLLVEEPEAHLHPQLQILLANHLARQGERVQTIVTTHSPTVAACLEPRYLAVMHRGQAGGQQVTRIDTCGLTNEQQKQLHRVLDVTRATLLFAQGVLLVEGISEALLIPALARRLGINLQEAAVSVVPVAGVDFASIGSLFGDGRIQVPLAIVTDADPRVEQGGPPGNPVRDPVTLRPEVSERAKRVLNSFAGQETIKVELSDFTLEYDLAAADAGNALAMFDAWSSLYRTRPHSLSRDELTATSSAEERALMLWRAICFGSPQHGKVQLAQELADRLESDHPSTASFVVPEYLARAIRHAARRGPG
jgi:putative ATP-dependent endonuclease of OLD family